MGEHLKKSIDKKVTRMCEERSMEIGNEDDKQELKRQSEHMNYVAKMSQYLIEMDKQKEYNEYAGLEPEIVWITARIHDLGDLEIGNRGYNRMRKPYHTIKCVEKSMKFLNDIGYNELYPEKTQKILDMISIHDDKDALTKSSERPKTLKKEGRTKPDETVVSETTAVVEADQLWRYDPEEFPENIKYVKEKKGRTIDEILLRLSENLKGINGPYLKTRVSKELAREWYDQIIFFYVLYNPLRHWKLE
jgi:hypothetical protein